MFFTKMYAHLLFRGALSASGQMIASASSWNILIQSATPLPRYMAVLSSFPLPPPGSTDTMLQNCYICLRWSRE